MRTVRAMFRTTATGEHGKRARQAPSVRPQVSEAPTFHQIPSRKGKRIKIIYCRALNDAEPLFAFCQADRGSFRVSAYDEVPGVVEEFGQMRGRRSKESYSHATRAFCKSPFTLVSIIDQRGEN